MLDTTQYSMALYFYIVCIMHLTPVCLNTHIFVMFLKGKMLSHYFTTKQYRIKRFSGVHACVHGAIMHSRTPYPHLSGKWSCYKENNIY